MDQRQQSSLWPTRRQVAWIAVGVAVLFVVIVAVGGYYFEWKWTGYLSENPGTG